MIQPRPGESSRDAVSEREYSGSSHVTDHGIQIQGDVYFGQGKSAYPRLHGKCNHVSYPTGCILTVQLWILNTRYRNELNPHLFFY